jgi:hypothetical protein
MSNRRQPPRFRDSSSPHQAEAVELGLGRMPGLDRHIRHYRNGRDMTAVPRDVMVIDLFGLSD